jgi:hypothetical protein
MSLHKRPTVTPALLAANRGAHRFSPSWLAAGRPAGGAASGAGVVRPGAGGTTMLHLRPAVGKGVRSPRRSDSLWALPWTPRRLGGLGTKPECSVKSMDRFPTSLSRIQVEIKDQRKVPLLKSRVRRSPLRPRRWETCPGLGRSDGPGVGKRGKGFGQGHRLGRRAGWEGNRNKAGMCREINRWLPHLCIKD